MSMVETLEVQESANDSPDDEDPKTNDNEDSSGDDLNGEDDDGAEDESSSSDSSSDDDGDGDVGDDDRRTTTEAAATATEDGRKLSDYEIQRLERIKRNQQYLSQLGLESEKNQPTTTTKRKNKKREKPSMGQKRTSSRARATINYAIDVKSRLSRGLVDTDVRERKKKEKKEKEDNDSKKQKQKEPRKRKPGDDRTLRMEKIVYLEFKRIKSHKNQTLKQAEKGLKVAMKHAKFWRKHVYAWERQQHRRQTLQQMRREQQEEYGCMGMTSRDLLRDIDRRMPELLAETGRYDETFEVAARQKRELVRQVEAEEKMRLIDALERFPKGMKDTITLLNTVLAERAPKDPPPPRRSRRTGAEELATVPKKRAGLKNPTKKPSAGSEADQWQGKEAILSLSSTNEHGDDEQHSAKRKRIARNVGGWVAPQFAEAIDRSWLEHDDPVDDDFDPSTYVPQVGDTVLYYPAGHRAFLEEYPDVLGKKTRSTMRIPLWEKARSEQKESCQEDKSKLSKAWWTEAWLERLESDLDRYPLICRVEKSHAEFPPDPSSKVKRGRGNSGVEVYLKSAKNVAKFRGTKLRLSISLRALTGLLPPRWDGRPVDDKELSPPPSFSVVSFPCKLHPFIIPFAWAYSVSHGYCSADSMSLRRKPGSKVRVSNFTALNDDSFGSFRFEDKVSVIQSVVKRFNSAPLHHALEQELSESSRNVPLQDARAVVESLRAFVQRSSDEASVADTSNPVRLIDIIRSTLPIWDSATLMKNVYNRKITSVMPWDMAPARKTRGGAVSSVESLGFQCLNEGLRLKIECAIEDYLSEDSAADIFVNPVVEDDAPSYNCAVPTGMCFDKILRRLKTRRGSSRQCYYRGAEQVLQDVSSVLDNCLLYNDPDSAVVDCAVTVVAKVKERISDVARNHYREVDEARRVDEERRLLVMRHCESPKQGNEENSDPADIVTVALRNPFKEKLDREWPYSMAASLGAPQAGDKILYSRERHASFVKGHFPSLEPIQCKIPSLRKASSAEPKGGGSRAEDSTVGKSEGEDWAHGKILWTRSAFPKAVSKKSGDDALTFATNAVLVALGLQLGEKEETFVIFWRPCFLEHDDVPDDASCCQACGLTRKDSFLRMSSSGDSGQRDTLSEDDRSSIDNCLSLLKRRCLCKIPPAYVDHQLTKANVKRGYKAQAKVGMDELPSFRHLFGCEQDDDLLVQGDDGGRKGSRKETEDDACHLLVENGFLPSWVSPVAGRPDVNMLGRAESVLALPSLCLELVQLRLRKGYYCHRRAVENDLLESYLSIVFSLLAESASRKKGFISLRRVARGLASGRLAPLDGQPNESSSLHQIFEEEASWLPRLRKIRELYAAALMSVSFTAHTERVFGLVSIASMQAQEEVAGLDTRDQDPVRRDARMKLDELFSAIGRDNLMNTFPSNETDDAGMPTMKVTVVCNGAVVPCKTRAVSRGSIDAQLKGKKVKLSVVCDGGALSREEDVDMEGSRQQLADNGHAIRESRRFDSSDYDHRDDRLARLLFRRPTRTRPCARCQVHRRSFQNCRVRRGHSNVDFDWISFFKEHSIEGLLAALRQGNDYTVSDNVATAAPLPSNGVINDKENPLKGNSPDFAGDSTTYPKPCSSAEGNSDVTVRADGFVPKGNDRDNCDTVDNDTPDPREFMSQAEGAVSLATEVLQEARSFAESVPRLGKKFLEESMPVDEEDGHYIYCIICGIGGNLLCCDGCPNVFHSECISLDVVPDGDWFCEECNMRKLSNKEGSDADARFAPDESQALAIPTSLPFGRTVFDYKKAKKLELLVRHLWNTRPNRRKQNDEGDEGGAVSNDDEEEGEKSVADVGDLEGEAQGEDAEIQNEGEDAEIQNEDGDTATEKIGEESPKRSPKRLRGSEDEEQEIELFIQERLRRLRSRNRLSIDPEDSDEDVERPRNTTEESGDAERQRNTTDEESCDEAREESPPPGETDLEVRRGSLRRRRSRTRSAAILRNENVFKADDDERLERSTSEEITEDNPVESSENASLTRRSTRTRHVTIGRIKRTAVSSRTDDEPNIIEEVPSGLGDLSDAEEIASDAIQIESSVEVKVGSHTRRRNRRGDDQPVGTLAPPKNDHGDANSDAEPDGTTSNCTEIMDLDHSNSDNPSSQQPSQENRDTPQSLASSVYAQDLGGSPKMVQATSRAGSKRRSRPPRRYIDESPIIAEVVAHENSNRKRKRNQT